MKKRIAFFGPLNPIPSGISDYDEELLPLLRQHYDVDVFCGSDIKRQHVYPHGDFLIRNRRNPYDLTLYQIGNSLLHETMYGYLFQFPGAVVFHDFCIHHSRAKMLLMRGMFDEYKEEAKWTHPEEPLLGKLVSTGMGSDLLLYFFPFVRLIVESSLAVAAHTDWAIEGLQNFGIPAIKIPMAVDVTQASRTSKESELFDQKIVLASFGFVTPEKRISSMLKVLIDLKHFYPNVRYVIVGEVASHYNLLDEIKMRNLQDVVHLTGRTTRDEFHQWMKRADIIINLRFPTAREMSATLLRAMALGKPVLISRLKHLQEFPDNTVIRIRPNNEQNELFHHLWQFIDNRSLREKLGESARAYIQTHHRPQQMLEKYLELIEIALQQKPKLQRRNLPLHLSSGRQIVESYMKKSMFGGGNSELLDLILTDSKTES